MKDKIYESFKVPDNEYRGKPFWSWNGELEREELIRQIYVMEEMGLGGFFMHSRTGLQTEYLGDKWFDLINECTDEAEKLNMEPWLYDEDRWPSGSAGGMVTREPKYRMKFIQLKIEKADEFEWSDDIIIAFTCELDDDFSYYNCCPLNKNTSLEEYENLNILVFKIIEMEKSSFYNGYTYLDTLNKEATEKFIEITYEKYKEECGDRLDSVEGIFTDEPHRGHLLMDLSDKSTWKVPWTYELFDSFKEKYGYELISKLPELFLKPEGKRISQIKWHYVELLQELFIENYARPVNDWCKDHDLILTGHILHEDSLTAQTAVSGSMMRFYEHMGYPGVDILTEGNKNYWVAKQAVSVARQLGQKWVLSEMYGCTGWQMTFENHKAVGDWQALFGINLRCHHLSWYTMEGQAKRDYPASILHQSTWWKEYDYVEDYFARINVVMTQGEPCCDVLVLNPVESIWAQVHAGWANGLIAHSAEIKKLESKYRKLFHWLAGANIDFDYGDEEMIDRLYKIEENEQGQPVLKIGEASYKIVVIAGMETIRATTLKIIKEFNEAGGEIIFSGQPPQNVDAVQSSKPEKFAKKVTQVSFDKNALINACRSKIDTDIQVINKETGENIEDIYCQMRIDKKGKNKYLMLMNVNREEKYGNVQIKIQTNGYIEEWNCVSGDKYEIKRQKEEGYTLINTEFYPAGEHLYVITPVQNKNLLKKESLMIKESNRISGPFKYELTEPNVCVLDMAEYKLSEGKWQEENEILKVDQKIRNELGMKQRSGDMIQPWYAKKHDENLKEIKDQLHLKYSFYIKELPEDNIELVIERPDNFEITLNNNKLSPADVHGWWIDKCFKKIVIPEQYLKKGKNIVRLKTGFHKGIDLEALYLIGEFGVELNGNDKYITSLPDKLEIGDIVDQGLPFFTGKINYKLDLNRYNIKNGEKAFIKTPEFEAACIKIKDVNNEKMKMIAWQPYEVEISDLFKENNDIELEVVLTRRNTFGPLHHVPLYPEAYGPGHFTTDGEGFTKQYNLIPSGLLNEPEFIIREEKK